MYELFEKGISEKAEVVVVRRLDERKEGKKSIKEHFYTIIKEKRENH